MGTAQRPKMLVDCHVFDKEFQGVQTYLLSLYRGIIGRQTDFDFIFVAKNTSRLRDLFGTASNFSFVTARFSNLLLRLNIDFPAIARKSGATHAHFQHIIPFIRPFKTIVTVHDLLVFDFPQYFPRKYRLLRKFFYSYSIKNANNIIAVSNYTRDRLHDRFRSQISRVTVIANTISKVELPGTVTDSRKLVQDKYGMQDYILCVSRHEPRKNLSAVLRAYLELSLHRKNIHLVFVGYKSIPDSEFERLLSSAPRDAVQCIHQYEQVAGDYLPHLYRAAKVNIYPSFAEGFGLPPLEAALLQAPVICSNATAMSDYTFFGRYSVSPDNNHELCSALTEIIAQPPQQELLSEIAEKIIQNFDPSHQSNNHVNFLKLLASGSFSVTG